MKLLCEVSTKPKGKKFKFQFLVRIANDPEKFHLHPTEFYEKWGKSIPQGNQHELEIIMPGEKFFKEHTLHVARSRFTNAPFICYPKEMSELTNAITVLRAWCLGSVLTILKGVDLNTVLTSCGDDLEKVQDKIKDEYGIWAPPVKLTGPVLYPFVPGVIEAFKNPNSPWNHYGYFTVLLVSRHVPKSIPKVIEREENTLIIPAGSVQLAGDQFTISTEKDFKLALKQVENIRNDDGKLLWVNKNMSKN